MTTYHRVFEHHGYEIFAEVLDRVDTEIHFLAEVRRYENGERVEYHQRVVKTNLTDAINIALEMFNAMVEMYLQYQDNQIEG